MPPRPALTIACVVVLLVACRTPAAAQGTLHDKSPNLMLLPSVQYGTPLRISGGLGLLVLTAEKGGFRRDGFLVEGVVGQGGASASFGVARFLEYAGLDVRGVLYRTGLSPRGAAADSTYGGAEVGLTIAYVRLGAGLARRLSGASGTSATVGTWKVSVHVPVPIR